MNRLRRFSPAFAFSDFTRNVITVLGGTLVAQAIPVLVSPLLTRWYSPADFGTFSLFASMAATLAVVATLRYEFAIMLPERRHDAIQVLAVSLLNACIISTLVFLGLMLFREPLLRWIKADALLPWVFLLPLYVLFAGVAQSFNYWFNRHKLYKYLSIVKASQSSVSAAVSVAFGLLKAGPIGLILGASLAQVSGALAFGLSYLKKYPDDWKQVNQRDFKRSYSRYKEFLIVNTPHALMNTMQDLIVIVLLTQNFSVALAGLYAFSYRILKLPVGLIGSSTYQVFLQKSNEVKSVPGELHVLTVTIMKRMALLGLVPFTLLAVAGPVLFRIVFGEEWEQAGYIARYISPWLYLNFIASSISAIAMIRERQKAAFGMAALDFAMQTGVVFLGAFLSAGTDVFIWMGITGAVYQLIVLRWFYNLSFVKTT